MLKWSAVLFLIICPLFAHSESFYYTPSKDPNVLDLDDYSPYFSKEDLKVIREVAIRNEQQNPTVPSGERRIFVVTEPEFPQGPVTVFGLSEKEVLAMDNDPNGAACSDQHNQGDMSNRWCHAYFVKLVDTYLKSRGINKHISAILAASIFLPKEFLYDKNPSASDLVIAEYELYNHFGTKSDTRMTVSVFGDMTVFLTWQKRF